ncbi:hypothetical protein KM043_003138 [Ampulex compressa]|nr:hypothetical protein KM043_003138 [Ampulex compressa]
MAGGWALRSKPPGNRRGPPCFSSPRWKGCGPKAAILEEQAPAAGFALFSQVQRESSRRWREGPLGPPLAARDAALVPPFTGRAPNYPPGPRSRGGVSASIGKGGESWLIPRPFALFSAAALPRSHRGRRVASGKGEGKGCGERRRVGELRGAGPPRDRIAIGQDEKLAHRATPEDYRTVSRNHGDIGLKASRLAGSLAEKRTGRLLTNRGSSTRRANLRLPRAIATTTIPSCPRGHCRNRPSTNERGRKRKGWKDGPGGGGAVGVGSVEASGGRGDSVERKLAGLAAAVEARYASELPVSSVSGRGRGRKTKERRPSGSQPAPNGARRREISAGRARRLARRRSAGDERRVGARLAATLEVSASKASDESGGESNGARNGKREVKVERETAGGTGRVGARSAPVGCRGVARRRERRSLEDADAGSIRAARGAKPPHGPTAPGERPPSEARAPPLARLEGPPRPAPLREPGPEYSSREDGRVESRAWFADAGRSRAKKAQRRDRRWRKASWSSDDRGARLGRGMHRERRAVGVPFDARTTHGTRRNGERARISDRRKGEGGERRYCPWLRSILGRQSALERVRWPGRARKEGERLARARIPGRGRAAGRSGPERPREALSWVRRGRGVAAPPGDFGSSAERRGVAANGEQVAERCLAAAEHRGPFAAPGRRWDAGGGAGRGVRPEGPPLGHLLGHLSLRGCDARPGDVAASPRSPTGTSPGAEHEDHLPPLLGPRGL